MTQLSQLYANFATCSKQIILAHFFLIPKSDLRLELNCLVYYKLNHGYAGTFLPGFSTFYTSKEDSTVSDILTGDKRIYPENLDISHI